MFKMTRGRKSYLISFSLNPCSGYSTSGAVFLDLGIKQQLGYKELGGLS